MLFLSHCEDLIGEVHDQINHARCDLNVEFTLRELICTVQLFVLVLLSVDLDFALNFSPFGLLLALILHLLILYIPLSLDLDSLGLTSCELHILARPEAFIRVGIVLLLFLLLQKLLDQRVFLLLSVETSLGGGLINGKFAASTLTLFASEVRLLLGLFDLVHRGGEREVLDLARWDALFLFLLLDGVVHVHVLIDSKFL
jgi:hypothetical protein